jgi:hypothetical protein
MRLAALGTTTPVVGRKQLVGSSWSEAVGRKQLVGSSVEFHAATRWPSLYMSRPAGASGAVRSAVRSDHPLAGGSPRGVEVGTNDPGERPSVDDFIPVPNSDQLDEKRVQLVEHLAHTTLLPGGHGTVESFLRGIEIVHDE